MPTTSEPGAEDHSTAPSAGASTADFVTSLDAAVQCGLPGSRPRTYVAETVGDDRRSWLDRH